MVNVKMSHHLNTQFSPYEHNDQSRFFNFLVAKIHGSVFKGSPQIIIIIIFFLNPQY